MGLKDGVGRYYDEVDFSLKSDQNGIESKVEGVGEEHVGVN